MDYFNGLGEIICFCGACQPEFVKLLSFALEYFASWPERQGAMNPRLTVAQASSLWVNPLKTNPFSPGRRPGPLKEKFHNNPGL